MPRSATREQVARDVELAVASARPDVEVVDVALIAPQHLVRVVIDHEAGVDLDLCQEVTRLLERLRESYRLEVSSPGLDRPLTKTAHFVRAVGENVHVRLVEPVDGRRNLTGRLVEAGEASLRLRLDGGEEIDVVRGTIAKSNIVWNPVKP